jgi:hypothetical protein
MCSSNNYHGWNMLIDMCKVRVYVMVFLLSQYIIVCVAFDGMSWLLLHIEKEAPARKELSV